MASNFLEYRENVLFFILSNVLFVINTPYKYLNLLYWVFFNVDPSPCSLKGFELAFFPAFSFLFFKLNALYKHHKYSTISIILRVHLDELNSNKDQFEFISFGLVKKYQTRKIGKIVKEKENY